jgi:hypothetical protein
MSKAHAVASDAVARFGQERVLVPSLLQRVSRSEETVA